MANLLNGAARQATPLLQQVGARPPDRRGIVCVGRIIKLMFGQGHGYIRMANDRDVYFHRADVKEGESFNTLAVNLAVTFELIEDRVSGARALQVTRRRR